MQTSLSLSDDRTEVHAKLLKPLQVCGRKNWLTERCETNWLKACGFRGWLWNSIPSIKRKQCSLSGWKTLYAWRFIEYFGEYFDTKYQQKITCDVRKSLRMNFLCCLRIIFSNLLRDEFWTFFVCFCLCCCCRYSLKCENLHKRYRLFYGSNFKLLLNFSCGQYVKSMKENYF